MNGRGRSKKEKRYILFDGLELSATEYEKDQVKKVLEAKGYVSFDDCYSLAKSLRPQTPLSRSVDEIALIAMDLNRRMHGKGVLE